MDESDNAVDTTNAAALKEDLLLAVEGEEEIEDMVLATEAEADDDDDEAEKDSKKEETPATGDNTAMAEPTEDEISLSDTAAPNDVKPSTAEIKGEEEGGEPATVPTIMDYSSSDKNRDDDDTRKPASIEEELGVDSGKVYGVDDDDSQRPAAVLAATSENNAMEEQSHEETSPSVDGMTQDEESDNDGNATDAKKPEALEEQVVVVAEEEAATEGDRDGDDDDYHKTPAAAPTSDDDKKVATEPDKDGDDIDTKKAAAVEEKIGIEEDVGGRDEDDDDDHPKKPAPAATSDNNNKAATEPSNDANTSEDDAKPPARKYSDDDGKEEREEARVVARLPAATKRRSKRIKEIRASRRSQPLPAKKKPASLFDHVAANLSKLRTSVAAASVPDMASPTQPAHYQQGMMPWQGAAWQSLDWKEKYERLQVDFRRAQIQLDQQHVVMQRIQQEKTPSKITRAAAAAVAASVAATATANNTNDQSDIIRIPNPNDVWMGPLDGLNPHAVGNKRFRGWIQERHERYKAAPNIFTKDAIVNELIHLVQTQTPPGRFVSRKAWVEEPLTSCRAKITQALIAGDTLPMRAPMPNHAPTGAAPPQPVRAAMPASPMPNHPPAAIAISRRTRPFTTPTAAATAPITTTPASQDTDIVEELFAALPNETPEQTKARKLQIKAYKERRQEQIKAAQQASAAYMSNRSPAGIGNHYNNPMFATMPPRHHPQFTTPYSYAVRGDLKRRRQVAAAQMGAIAPTPPDHRTADNNKTNAATGVQQQPEQVGLWTSYHRHKEKDNTIDNNQRRAAPKRKLPLPTRAKNNDEMHLKKQRQESTNSEDSSASSESDEEVPLAKKPKYQLAQNEATTNAPVAALDTVSVIKVTGRNEQLPALDKLAATSEVDEERETEKDKDIVATPARLKTQTKPEAKDLVGYDGDKELEDIRTNNNQRRERRTMGEATEEETEPETPGQKTRRRRRLTRTVQGKFDEAFDANLARLYEFSFVHGHLDLPWDEYGNLKSWIIRQRKYCQEAKEGLVTPLKLDQIMALTDLGLLEEDWETRIATRQKAERLLKQEELQRQKYNARFKERFPKMLEELKAYKAEHGNIDAATGPLRNFVNALRRHYAALKEGKDNPLEAQHIVAITELGISLAGHGKNRKRKLMSEMSQQELRAHKQKMFDARFDKKLALVKAYKEKHGNANIPSTDTKLHGWITKQRKSYREMMKGTTTCYLQLRHIKALNDLGVNIDVSGMKKKMSPQVLQSRLEAQFITRMEEAKAFKAEHGHFNFPKNSSLLSWFTKHRRLYTDMQEGKPGPLKLDHVLAFSNIGLPLTTIKRIPKGIEVARQYIDFVKKNGGRHPKKFGAGSGEERRMGSIATKWRQKHRLFEQGIKRTKDKGSCEIPQEVYDALKEVDFDWNFKQIQPKRSVVKVPWEERLELLKAYKAKHGHTEVPKRHPKLGGWCVKQRQQYKHMIDGKPSLMSVDRFRQLAEIGFRFKQRGKGENRNRYVDDRSSGYDTTDEEDEVDRRGRPRKIKAKKAAAAASNNAKEDDTDSSGSEDEASTDYPETDTNDRRSGGGGRTSNAVAAARAGIHPAEWGTIRNFLNF